MWTSFITFRTNGSNVSDNWEIGRVVKDKISSSKYCLFPCVTLSIIAFDYILLVTVREASARHSENKCLSALFNSSLQSCCCSLLTWCGQWSNLPLTFKNCLEFLPKRKHRWMLLILAAFFYSLNQIFFSWLSLNKMLAFEWKKKADIFQSTTSCLPWTRSIFSNCRNLTAWPPKP